MAVVIAFYGDQWLRNCIDFVDEAEEGNLRVVIGDNYGNTTVESLVDGRRVVSVDLSGPLGFVEANNQAVLRNGFNSEIYCFLNQDTKSPAGWLIAAANFMAQHPDVGALTPLISTYDGDGPDPNFVACTRPLEGFWDELARSEGAAVFYEVPVIPAAAMVVRTEVLRRVGGFDPVYGSYYEDYDLCLRIRQGGYRVGIWTGATIAHLSGSATQTPEAERRRQRLIVRNRIIYRVRAAGSGRLQRLLREVALELPRQLGRRLLGRQASKPLAVLLGGYWDAAKVVRRLASYSYDHREWQAYLTDVGWPSS